MATKSFRNSTFCKTLIAASIAAGLGASAGVYADSADSSMPQPHSDGVVAAVTDTAITAKVKSQFIGEAQFKKSDIDVTTTNGVVKLTGWVSNSDAKSAAERLTSSVDGVKSIDDELKTTAPTAAAAADTKMDKAVTKTKKAVSDSWITTKVKSEIMADSVSKGFKVSVTTTHGVVELTGTLANEEAIAHVKDLAEKVKGVKSVNTSAMKIAST